MTDLSELERRLSEATGADHDLDIRIYCWAEGVTYKPEGFYRVRDTLYSSDWNVPAYTASIDAALALVERKLPKDDGWAYSLVHDYAGLRRCHLNISPCCDGWPVGGLNSDADAETMPLAILIALIRVLATQEPTNAK